MSAGKDETCPSRSLVGLEDARYMAERGVSQRRRQPRLGAPSRWRWRCPCRVCPRCGWNDDDGPHPEDGLAYCPRCHNEWWAHVGPLFGRRCPKSRREAEAWREYDNAVWAAAQERESDG